LQAKLSVNNGSISALRTYKIKSILLLTLDFLVTLPIAAE